MNINGIAHLCINVRRFEECVVFYKKLFNLFEMKIIFESADAIYGVGARTGIRVARVGEKYKEDRFDQNRVGLHHLCFRARSREDVDEVFEFLKRIEANIVKAPDEGPWAPGYYYVLFEDPDGIRLEVNFVPGKGNLEPSLEKTMHDPTKT